MEKDIFAMFGLTSKQSSILFSLESLLVLEDITKTNNIENASMKRKWLAEWKASLKKVIVNDAEKRILSLDLGNLISEVKEELSQSNDKTWYHLILLEAVAFEAYTPLGNTAADKKYSRLKYKQPLEYIKKFAYSAGFTSPELVARLDSAYKRAQDLAHGKIQKNIIKALAIVAAAAVVAASAGALAGPIAVALFGSQFAGLGGAALVSACLAFAGGGALAVGGAGMAGGVMAIVGGGALLGMAGAGAGVGLYSAVAKASPEFAISQGAKLNVVLSEIILNSQRDIQCAQAILEKYKDQISEMHKEISRMNLEREKDKRVIDSMKKTVDALERLYKDAIRFASSFETGSEI